MKTIFNKKILKVSCQWAISTMKVSVLVNVHFLRQLGPVHHKVHVETKVLRGFGF